IPDPWVGILRKTITLFRSCLCGYARNLWLTQPCSQGLRTMSCYRFAARRMRAARGQHNAAKRNHSIKDGPHKCVAVQRRRSANRRLESSALHRDDIAGFAAVGGLGGMLNQEAN